MSISQSHLKLVLSDPKGPFRPVFATRVGENEFKIEQEEIDKRELYFKAICILLLLAKFQGDKHRQEQGLIIFAANEDDWVPETADIIAEMEVPTGKHAWVDSEPTRSKSFEAVADYTSFTGGGYTAKKIEEKLRMPKDGDTWYLLTVNPTRFRSWRPYLEKALLNYKITIHWAFLSPDALTWKQTEAHYSSYCNALAYRPASRKTFLKDILKASIVDLGHLNGLFDKTAGRALPKGVLKCYQLNTFPFYIGIVTEEAKTPPGNKNQNDKSFCMIAHFKMFGHKETENLGIYAESPGEIYRSYLDSMRNLFLLKQDGLIKEVSLQKL